MFTVTSVCACHQDKCSQVVLCRRLGRVCALVVLRDARLFLSRHPLGRSLNPRSLLLVCVFHAFSSEAKEWRLTQFRRRCYAEGDGTCFSSVTIDSCNSTVLICVALRIFNDTDTASTFLADLYEKMVVGCDICFVLSRVLLEEDQSD